MRKFLLTAFSIATVFAANAQTLTDSLKVHLRFNGNTDDTSGNGNHGTLVGATLGPWTCSFDGDGDYITLPATDIFNTEYTYSLWFKITTALPNDTKMVLLGVGGADCGQSISLTKEYFGYNGLVAIGYDQIGGTYNANSVSMPPQNFWTHVVSVKTTDSILIYVDGNLIQGVPTPSQSACYSGANPRGVVGAGVVLNQHFTGTIADVRIYSRPLGAGEVNNLFNMNILSHEPAKAIAYKLFPNPSANRQLILQTAAYVNSVHVFDMTGKEISISYDRESGLITLDNSMSAGTYLVAVKTGKGVISERIVIQ